MRKINKAVKAEIRINTTFQPTTTVNTTAAVTCLNMMQTGDLDGYRMASQIHMISLYVKAQIYGGDTAGNVVRVAIVYDKQANGAALTDALLNFSTGVPLSQSNWVYRKRFKVLYDKLLPVEATKPIVLRKMVKINRNATYTSSGGSYTDIATGALWIFYISDSGAAPNPTLEYAVRLYYNP